MTIDISSFRSIAAQSPDRVVYMRGEKLKSAKTQGARGPEVFKAAVDAFIKAYGDHYGAKLGNMSRQSLQEYADGAKPLTASVVKQMLDYADGKIGSARTVTVGGATIDISKIGTENIPFLGFGGKTRANRIDAGCFKAMSDVFAAFERKDGGKVDAAALLKKLNTLGYYLEKEYAQLGLADAAGRAEWRDTLLETGVRDMDNRALSAVYQGIASRETEALKDELARLMEHPDVSGETQRLAERAFTDVCRLEAFVLGDVSARIKAGDGGQRGDGSRDVTAANLALLVGAGAKGAIAAKDGAKAVESKLKAHGMDAVEARQIGDTIRNNELTVNMHLKYLLGWEGLDKGRDKPAFLRPGGQVLNAFQVQEATGGSGADHGYLKLRNEVETSLFPEYGCKAAPDGKDRPVYAALNTKRFTSGAADTLNATYGRAVVVLKEHVKKQCTYTLGDTFFVERFAVKAGDFEPLLGRIADTLADQLVEKESVLAALRGDAMVKGAFSAMMAKVSPDGKVVWDAVKTFSGEILPALAPLAKDGAALEADDIEAVFMERYADFGEARGKVATYDNVETLFAGAADFSAVKMAVGTLARQRDPNTSLRVDGADYIEAQIHSPVSFETDVAEIRINVQDVVEHFEAEFQALGDEERAAVENDPALGANAKARRDAWIAARKDAEIARIQEMAKDAPFPVTFYDAKKTLNAETLLNNAAEQRLRNETYDHFKDEVEKAAAELRTPRGRNGLLPDVCRRIDRSRDGATMLFALYGDDLSRLPKAAFAGFDAKLDERLEKAARKNSNVVVEGVAGLRSHAAGIVAENVDGIINVLAAIDRAGVKDEKEIRAYARQILDAKVPFRNIGSFIAADRAGKKAIADLGAFASAAVARHVPGGAQLLQDAFNGLSPLGNPRESRFYGLASDVACNEVAAIKKEIAKLGGQDAKKAAELAAGAEERIARKLAEFVRVRAELVRLQKDCAFPSEGERNALIGWATSAGKLRRAEELRGVYESSSLLVDAFEKKLSSGEPLKPADIVDAFLSFHGACKASIERDIATSGKNEFGPDDENTAFSRATSVAISRLGARLGPEALKRLAAALATTQFQTLAVSAQTAVQTAASNSIYNFSVFFSELYRCLPERAGMALPYPSATAKMGYSFVAPANRALFARIDAAAARRLDASSPYDPAKGGVRPLLSFPPPANPAGLPQSNAGRKKFLKDMLSIYHANEKGYDYGKNYHGRGHAARAFVFSVAMSNILKEKGVPVDLNAVALGTAGHDTGRMSNGKEQEGSEERSAGNVNAKVEELYPGAAGDAWKAQIKTAITTDEEKQTTVEGYVFKSADSIEIVRLGEIDGKKFPFLREPLLAGDGLVVMPDRQLRGALVKEAQKLAEATSPRARLTREAVDITKQMVMAKTDVERNMLQRQQKEKIDEGRRLEEEQTDKLSDGEIVELVENTIRARPQDFPLLTKYYLDAE